MRSAVSKGERTRERIANAAADLLRRRGYRGTGLAQIVAASGAPRGSLYFHFPGGKEEIACAAIAASGERWRALLEGVVNSAESAPDALVAVCDFLATDLEQSGFESGCPAATVALETSSDNELVRLACAALYEGWTAIIANRIARAGASQERADRLASVVLSAIEGALLLARVRKDASPIRDVGRSLVEMMNLGEQ